ncbi:uncharacterized protein [Halyomorpha halys]|uniref:uncharacterized protein n=1 Tax=Halyomorpha halys TaxID=286706 RepID=UPI0006D4D335|nr:uncharacterized protein LOC106690062 [Halyomorpha halys]
MAHLAQDRTAEAVIVALRTWFQLYGVPRLISSDEGREFDNATIRGEMKTLEVDWHINTPGHPKSRRGIERLHSTLSEHLLVYHADKGLEPDEAMVRAIAAYNHSIHTATGFSPFEVLLGLQGRRRNFMDTAEADGEIVNHGVVMQQLWEKARGRIEGEKRRRVERQNLNRGSVMGDIRIGTVVYHRLGSNRSKESRRYEGPFRVITIREHNVVTIESIQEPRRRGTVHVEQLRFPAITTPETPGVPPS